MKEATHFDWWIPGNPVPKLRPRVMKGYSFTPKKTRDAEKAIALFATIKLGPYWRTDKASRWSVSCAFYCKTRVRGDSDNLQKLVLDALSGIVWANDKQVYRQESSIASEAAKEPGIHLTLCLWEVEIVGCKPQAPIAAHLGSC